MRSLISLLLLIIFSNTKAQNLIINGSFEDANICTEIKQPCSPSAWFYTKSHPHGFSIKSSIKASDGDHILQIAAINAKDDTRSYWQTMLQCKLIKGEEYVISVDIAAISVGPNLNDLGFYFTDSFQYALTDTILQPSDYQSMKDAKVKRLSDGWYRLQKKFIADNNNQIMVVGNFTKESNKQILSKRNTSATITYFIDKLSLIPSSKTLAPIIKHLLTLYMH
jgi:hypothetical protein